MNESHPAAAKGPGEELLRPDSARTLPPGTPFVRSHSAAGFTLTEVLIAGSIAAMLATAMVSVLSQFSTLAEDTYAERRLNQQLQRATGLMRKDVSQARQILTTGKYLILISADEDTIAYRPAGAALDTLLRYGPGATPAVIATALDTFWVASHAIGIPGLCERMVPDTSQVTIQECDESDMDELVDGGGCDEWDLKEREIKDDHWIAEQFWDTGDHASFGEASVLVVNRKSEVEVDLILDIYLGNGPGGYPGTLLAQGRIPKGNITTAWAWHTCGLTTIVDQPVVDGVVYWLLARHDGSGGSTYAGHVQWGEAKSCDYGPPSNGMCYWKTDNAGGEWKDANAYRETLFRVTSPVYSTKLAIVTEDLPDTLGVSYELVLSDGETSTRSEGFIALHNR